jgi:hypothetical protein
MPAPTSEAILSSCGPASPHSSGTNVEALTPCRDNHSATSPTRDSAAARVAGSSTISTIMTSVALRSIGKPSATARLASAVSFQATRTVRKSSQLQESGTTNTGRPACMTRSPGADLHKGIAQSAAACLTHHNNIASPRLLNDVPGRKVFGAAPFELSNSILHYRTKLAFHLRYMFFNRCPPSIISCPCLPEAK